MILYDDYEILESLDTGRLAMLVNERIKEGYQPIGTMCVAVLEDHSEGTYRIFHQAVAKCHNGD